MPDETRTQSATADEFDNANATGGATHNENQRITYANLKRTYDVYQDLDVQAARQAQIEQTRMNQIASQALQNAVETANMVAKQHMQLNNLAHDSFWNPVAAGTGMNLTAGAVPANRATDVAAAGTGVAAETVAGAVAKQVDASVAPVIAALQQIIQALATATTSIGNVVAQAQPKA